MTARLHAVAVRDEPAADKKVGMAVAIEITDCYTGRVLEDVGQRVAGAREVPLAVVEIQAGSQRFVFSGELVSSADNDQVQCAVAVGVEERGAGILSDAVCRDRRLIGGAKRPVALLHEQPTRLPLRTTDVKVVETVAVDVAD